MDAANEGDRERAAPRAGWQNLLSGPLACETLAADHEGMLRRPHTERLAELMRRFFSPYDDLAPTVKGHPPR